MSDLEVFKQTCDEPYIRHNYKLVYKDGRSTVFDNYEDVQLIWFQSNGHFLSHVEVLDKKKSNSKGFK